MREMLFAVCVAFAGTCSAAAAEVLPIAPGPEEITTPPIAVFTMGECDCTVAGVGSSACMAGPRFGHRVRAVVGDAGRVVRRVGAGVGRVVRWPAQRVRMSRMYRACR